MDVHASHDENAAVEPRGKAFASAARALGTPGAPAAGPSESGRRAFGNISNKTAAAAATPRRALGDITNGAAAAKPAACSSLPAGCSARTASFITAAILAQAEAWAAEPSVEDSSAGPTAAEQEAQERQAAASRVQARAARVSALDTQHCADDGPVRTVDWWLLACD